MVKGKFVILFIRFYVKELIRFRNRYLKLNAYCLTALSLLDIFLKWEWYFRNWMFEEIMTGLFFGIYLI